MENLSLVILTGGRAKRLYSSGTIDKSRFPDKALVPINGEPNLINTLKKTEKIFDRFYIVINEKDTAIFEKTLENYQNKIKLIPLPAEQSGLGSGRALMEALLKIEAHEFILIWGDGYINNTDLIEELIHYESNSDLIIPLCKVNKPYVSFLLNPEFKAIAIDFGKYEESHDYGYQDRSIFKIRKSLLNSLEIFHKSTWKNCRYITETNEFEFLYIIHLLWNFKKPAHCFITENIESIYYYNTPEELIKIKTLTERT